MSQLYINTVDGSIRLPIEDASNYWWTSDGERLGVRDADGDLHNFVTENVIQVSYYAEEGE